MVHKFILIVKQYERKNLHCDAMRTIYSGNTCLVAKNKKHGGLYLHKSAKIIKGRFLNAGSNSYPELLAKGEVHIEFTLPFKPDLKTDQRHPQDILVIKDI